jgi:hypothetical protein
MTHLPARTGWEWLKQGMRLFRQQPAALTTLLLANTLLANLLLAIGISALDGYIGPLLVVILIPSLSMSFMQACLMIDNGDRITLGVLMTGFRKDAAARLFKVGVIYFGVFALLMLVGSAVMPESLRHLPMNVTLDPGGKLPFSGQDVLVMFGLTLLQIVSLLVLCFAAPLAYWKRMGPGKAAFYSFFAVVRAARAFCALLLSWFGIFTGIVFVIALVFTHIALAQVVAMWLMFLFVLVLQCAIYASYRDIFGKPDIHGAVAA